VSTSGSSGSGGATGSSSASSTGSGGGGHGGGDAGAPGTPTFAVAGYDLRRILSTDGTNWVHDVSDPPDPMMLDNIGDGIAFGNGYCVVVAHSGLVTTRDGITWTKIGAPLPQQWPGLGGGKVLWTGSTFVIIASADSYLSPDGVTWTKHTSNASATHWNGFAYGNGHFVAVGDSNSAGGDRKTSEDGQTWHDYVTGGPRWGGVAFGNGMFVAVGDGGTIKTTKDGVTWTDTSDASLGNLGNLVFANGVFLTCADSGCYTSPDGASWTMHASNNWPGGAPIGFGMGMYFAVTWASNILTSKDGFSWKLVFQGAQGSNAFASVGFGVLGP
jgi:hypothetical protein